MRRVIEVDNTSDFQFSLGSALMQNALKSSRTKLLKVVQAGAFTVCLAGGAAAAPAPSVDEKELLNVGFKPLVATTKVQQDWVRSLAPGQIRAMQRTGKKLFIYPDASNNRILIGGPKEFDAYMQVHPDTKLWGQGSAAAGSAYRAKQSDTMQKATERDLSNPFLGAEWVDLGL